MLRIYDLVRSVIRRMAEIIREIERHDADLARQMRRALTSVALNLREGSQSQGRNRNARYWNALGSMSEALGGLDVAEDFGYVEGVDEELRRDIARIMAALLRIIGRR